MRRKSIVLFAAVSALFVYTYSDYATELMPKGIICHKLVTPVTPENTVIAVDFHGVIGDFSMTDALKRFWEHPERFRVAARVILFFAKKYFKLLNKNDHESATQEVLVHGNRPQQEYSDYTLKLINPFVINPGTYKLVEELHNAGYKLLLFSDMGIMTYHMEAQRHPEFFALFDDIRVRGTNNNYAPKKTDTSFQEAYAKARGLLGENLENVIFFDDNRKHVKRSADNGMCGIVFKNAKQTAQALNKLGIAIDPKTIP